MHVKKESMCVSTIDFRNLVGPLLLVLLVPGELNGETFEILPLLP